MSKSNTIKITSNLNLALCKEHLERYESSVADRDINFKDNMHWPDQYVVSWKDSSHFKIANWVHLMGGHSAEYREDEFWEVEVSGNATQLVLMLEKHPSKLKNKMLIFSGLVLISAVLVVGKLVPKTYLGLGWAILLIVFFFRTFIFEDETTHCVRFLERILNPEKRSK